MDAPRRRFGSLVEWLVAAVCVGAALSILSIAVQEFRSVRAVVPVIAKEASPVVAVSGIPPGVVPVPLLLLGDNRELRIGERLTDVVERLGSSAQLISESVDDVNGRRLLTRFYNDVGGQFILVFEAATRDVDSRLSAIFIR